MSDEKSTEEQTQKIEAIVSDDALGYEGSAHAEHSGQTTEPKPVDDSLAGTLADNRPEQIK